MSVYVTVLLSPFNYCMRVVFDIINSDSPVAVTVPTALSWLGYLQSLTPKTSKLNRCILNNVVDAFNSLREELSCGVDEEQARNEAPRNLLNVKIEDLLSKCESEIKSHRLSLLEQKQDVDAFDLAWRY